MLEIETKFSKKINILSSQDLPACPVNYENLYKQIKNDVTWEVNHQLEWEEYYLSEQDYNSYTEKNFNVRLEKIEELRNKTSEQKEKEIHSKVMAEIFTGIIHKLPAQAEIFNAPHQPARKEAA